MSILLIGDPHLKVDNALESVDFISATNALAFKLKPKFIVLLGDILDTHEKINLYPFCRATDFIKNLSQIAKTFVLIGNHDRVNNSVYLTEEHPFMGLKGIENIVIVDEVVRYEDYIFVPYVPTGRFKEALKTVGFEETEKIKAIFAHQEFMGSKDGDYVSENGDMWQPNFPKIYSGHIHQAQTLGNITYVGTPFQHSFTDSVHKTVMILDENGEEERIELDIIKKRQVNINVKDLSTYKVDENFITKLVIEGEDKSIRKYLVNKEIQEMLRHPNIKYKIKYLNNSSLPIKEDKEVLSFSKILEKKIKDKNNILLTKLFSEIDL